MPSLAEIFQDAGVMRLVGLTECSKLECRVPYMSRSILFDFGPHAIYG